MNRLGRFVTIISVAVVVGIASLVAIDDNHKTNLKYLMWKHHLVRYEPKLALRYFNVDAEFRLSLIGKTRTEVEAWFPILRQIDKEDSYLPTCGEAVWKPGFVWIDSSRWGIVFENDRARDIILFKG